MILVTGATGDIGSELCRLLSDTKEAIRALCRKQAQIEQFRQQGIEAVLGDFEKPETLKAAMQSCDRLFLLTPPSPQQVHWEKNAINAAKEAGIQRIVKLSAADANLGASVSWAQAHAEIDHHLRSIGITWTILKPTAFMQNFLQLAKPLSRGILPQVAGNGKVSYIDTRDVALVARQVLTEDHHQGATYFLTGPEALTMKEIAARLSVVMGKKVRYINLPTPVFWVALRLSGVSGWLASGLIKQFAKVVAGGHGVDVTGEVSRLIHQPPRTFAEFAESYKTTFEAKK